MKILLDVEKAIHKEFLRVAKQREVPVRNLYAATLRDAVELEIIATVANVEPRKPRSDRK
jgi:hypothetical protein